MALADFRNKYLRRAILVAVALPALAAYSAAAVVEEFWSWWAEVLLVWRGGGEDYSSLRDFSS